MLLCHLIAAAVCSPTASFCPTIYLLGCVYLTHSSRRGSELALNNNRTDNYSQAATQKTQWEKMGHRPPLLLFPAPPPIHPYGSCLYFYCSLSAELKQTMTKPCRPVINAPFFLGFTCLFSNSSLKKNVIFFSYINLKHGIFKPRSKFSCRLPSFSTFQVAPPSYQMLQL